MEKNIVKDNTFHYSAAAAAAAAAAAGYACQPDAVELQWGSFFLCLGACAQKT